MLAFWLSYQVVKHIHLLSVLLLKSEQYSETKHNMKDGSEHKTLNLCQENALCNLL